MPQPADLIISNARVLTQDLLLPRAAAVAVRGTRIVGVGSVDDCAEFKGPATRMVDAQQCTLLPGFIDSHLHLLSGAIGLGHAQLQDAGSAADVQRLLREHDHAHAGQPGLRGLGLRYNIISQRAQLDAVAADRPLLVTAYDGHTAWANTCALQQAGILNGGEPTGPNSVIVRDAAGVATGELREAGAMEPVRKLFPDPSTARQRQLVQHAVQLLNAAGVTSVHNMDGDLEQMQLYQAMEQAHEMSLRVYVPYHVTPAATLEMLAEAAEMQSVRGAFVRGGAAKFFMDGVLESYTALLVTPYADALHTRGDALFSLDHFIRMAGACDRMGLQVAVHCCGDGAVRRALDGFAEMRRLNGPRDSRHRIEHIELIAPSDLQRFRKLDVIASMQTAHCPPDMLANDVWPARAGHDRWPLSFAWRAVRTCGAHFVNGSDWSVASFNPMLGLDAGLNRMPWAPGQPNDHLTLYQLLPGYTRDAAWAEFKEHEKGRVCSGLLADLVLLDADLEQTAPELVKNVRPVMTVVDGRIVHGAG
ncbi:MAG: hypothetical protein RLY92_1559 [Chloroflexota bacterium]